MLDEKKVKRIISFHEALGYFARTFDLRIAAVMEPGPGDEPNAAHLAKLKTGADPVMALPAAAF